MHCAALALAAGLSISVPADSDNGVINGIVVNGTQAGAPSPRAGVVLRVRVEGQFVPLAAAQADEEGRFQFTQLPIGLEYLYLPGANCDEVHYPGPRLRLTAARPLAAVRLEVFDAVAYPNPLELERQEILIQPQAGALRVTETLLIHNPTATTYVGQSEGEAAEPVTLKLAIPPDFERTTFHKEFFGRQFLVAGDRLVTRVPWTPGRRELKFTYTLRRPKSYCLWQRPLDLPCRGLRLRIRHDKAEDTACNLNRVGTAEPGEILFESARTPLPAGHVIRLQLGQLPVPWTSYARWAAVGLLAGLVALASAVGLRKPRLAASLRTVSSRRGSQGPSSKRGAAARIGVRSRRRRAA